MNHGRSDLSAVKTLHSSLFSSSKLAFYLLEGRLHSLRALNAERHVDRPKLRAHAALARTRNV